MNKSELAVKLAKKIGLTQAKAAEVVDAIFNATRASSPSSWTPATRSPFLASAPSRPASGARARAATPRPARRSTSRRVTTPVSKAGKTLKERSRSSRGDAKEERR